MPKKNPPKPIQVVGTPIADFPLVILYDNGQLFGLKMFVDPNNDIPIGPWVEINPLCEWQKQGSSTQTKARTKTDSWQPIETAPKHGGYVLLWGEKQVLRSADRCLEEKTDVPVKAYWNQVETLWKVADGMTFGIAEVRNATHWMPLPESPKPRKRR